MEVTYEQGASDMCQKAVNAEWEYNTDLGNEEKEQAATDANIAYSKYIFEQWNTVLRHYNYSDFTDDSLKRQLKFLNIVGTAALNEEDLTQVSHDSSNMTIFMIVFRFLNSITRYWEPCRRFMALPKFVLLTNKFVTLQLKD